MIATSTFIFPIFFICSKQACSVKNMNVVFGATDFLHGPPHLRFCGWPFDWIVSVHMSPPGGAGSQCYEAGRRQEGVEAEQGMVL